MKQAVFATRPVKRDKSIPGFNATYRPVNVTMKTAFVEDGHPELIEILKAANVKVKPLSQLDEPKTAPKPTTAETNAVKGE